MKAKIVTAGDNRSLEEAFLRDLIDLKKCGPLSPVSILCGSNTQGRYLRTLSARRLGGLFNADILTFPDLLSALERVSDIPPLKGLPPFAPHAIVEGLLVAGEAPRYFSPIIGTRGFPDAAIAAFSDLSEAGCTVDMAGRMAAESRTAPGLKALLALFASYRRMVDSNGGDIHTRFERILEGKDARPMESPLLVYGFYDLNERQWNLLEHAGNSTALTLYVPWRDETCYRFAEPLVKRCAAAGFDREEFPPGAKGGSWPGEIGILSVPDTEAEALEIAGKILESGGKGIRFGDMAVALTPGCDGRLIAEILEDSGIPYHTAGKSLLESSAEARGALRLCRLLSGDLSRLELVDFLVSAPLAGAVGTGGDGDPLAAWVRISALEGMTGERGWLEENALLVEKLSRLAASGHGETGALPAAVLAGGIIGKIIAARKFRGGNSWSSLAGNLSSLAADLFAATREMAAVCEAINSLSSLDSLPGGVSASLFPSLVEKVLGSPRGFTGSPAGEGVQILPLTAIRGLRFRVLFVAGMTEDSIPGIAGRDPFLPDEARESLERMLNGRVRFSKRSSRAAELELVFRLSCMGADDRLVCSHPRAEAGSGREKPRSSFLAFLERAAVKGGEPGKSIVSRVPGGIGSDGKRIPVSEDEYCLLSAAAAGGLPGNCPGRLFLSRGIVLEKARWSKFRLTPYDGVLESPESPRRLAAMLDESMGSYSSTSLERWARCPFAFFMKNILRIESVEEPERIVSIDPLQRGTLVHSLLQRLYESLGKNALLPIDACRMERVRDHAAAFMEKFLDEYSSGAPVGVAAFWEIEKSRIKRAVLGLLSSEAREEEGLAPVLFEEPFGLPFDAAPVSFDTGSRMVSFHGRIDRIDRAGDGRFRVIDYKTGRLSGADDDMRGGTALQLPVYLLAASAILALPLEKGSARYRRVSDTGGKTAVSFDGSRWKDAGRELAGILDTIVGGIGAGLFFMYPDEAGCGFCDIRAACPSSRRLLFEQKVLNDPRAGGFLAMRREGRSDA